MTVLIHLNTLNIWYGHYRLKGSFVWYIFTSKI